MSSRRAIFYWSVIGVVFLGVIINGATGLGSEISKAVHEHELVDKVGHVVFFGSLSFLIHRGLRLHLTCSTWVVILVSCSIGFVLGIADEYSQLWIEGRNFDYTDLWANFAGAALLGPLGCLTLESPQSEAEDEPDPFEFALRRPENGKGAQPSVFLSNRTARSSRSVGMSSGHRRRPGR